MHRLRTIIFVILFVAAACSTATAKGVQKKSFPRLTFGIESSFSGTFLSYRHANFVSGYGYRVNRKTVRHDFHGNGEFQLHVGCNVSANVNLSVYGGYAGACQGIHIYPVTLRCTWFPYSDPMADRWFVFADGGPALKMNQEGPEISYTCKLGGGYRISLSRSAKLDFLLALRNVFIKNIFSIGGTPGSEYVPHDKVRRNNADFLALTFGIGMTF